MSIEAAFTGRVGKPPEARTSTKGTAWKSLSLAVGSGDDLEWVQVAVFEPLLDELPPDLEKGERIYVEGKLRLNKWRAKDGGERSNLQVSASRIVVLDRIGRRRRATRREKPALGEGRGTDDAVEPATTTAEHANGAHHAHAVPDDPVPI